jgi:hypothetical protein
MMKSLCFFKLFYHVLEIARLYRFCGAQIFYLQLHCHLSYNQSGITERKLLMVSASPGTDVDNVIAEVQFR